MAAWLSGESRGSDTEDIATVYPLLATPGPITQNLGGGAQNLRAEPLIIVDWHPDGPVGNDAVIQGFVFQSGNAAAGATPGGDAALAVRALSLVIRGNRAEGGHRDVRPAGVEWARRAQPSHRPWRELRDLLAVPGEYQVTGNRQMGLELERT